MNKLLKKKVDLSQPTFLFLLEKFSPKGFKTYGVNDCSLIVDHFNDARRGLLLGALVEGPDTDGHLYTRHSYL